MKPRAKKKARAMSQGMGSPKAEKALAKVSVLVRTDAPRPRSATAPSGSGWVMMPTIVARKMARSCHAFLETPLGTGRNQMRTPVAMEAARGFSAAPCHGCGGEGELVAADARMLVLRRWISRNWPSGLPRGVTSVRKSPVLWREREDRRDSVRRGRETILEMVSRR